MRRLAALVAAAALVLAFGATPTNAAGIIVNTLTDGTGGPDCSLGDAIAAANTDTAQGGCTTGDGVDVISFSVTGTITLGSALPDIASDVTIDGGSAITVDGANNYRPFTIEGATVTFAGLTIIHGSASHGGGIDSNGTLTVAHSTITGNTALIQGGGINSEVALTVTDSTICGNTALTQGGGISFNGTASITNSTICENTAVRQGGGILAYGVATITNTTIVANAAQGGAIVPGHLAGGGMNTFVPGTHLANTILAGNEGGDSDGPIVAKTSLTARSSPSGMTMGDLFVVDASGNPVLADNGGPTKTIALALVADNPAIDTGDSATCAAAPVNGLDQRGLARPTACDMGAYEAQAPTVSQTPPPTGGIAIPNGLVSAPYLALGLLGILGLLGLIGILLVARKVRRPR